MTDTPQRTPNLPDEQFTLTVHKDKAGLWYVTGSMHPSLLVVGDTFGEALSKVSGAWAELLWVELEQKAHRALFGAEHVG